MIFITKYHQTDLFFNFEQNITVVENKCNILVYTNV